MAEGGTEEQGAREVEALTDQLRRARVWAWSIFELRAPGTARDLAWATINLARDHDPDTYSPWLNVPALEPEALRRAVDLASDIARLIRKADTLQPHLMIKPKRG